jgi:hypothetical protein
MAKYYFNTKTGEVSKGGLFSWWNKMGPYDTPEEAAHALDKARARTEKWDNEDEREHESDGQ